MKKTTWIMMALLSAAAPVAAQGVATTDPARAAIEKKQVAAEVDRLVAARKAAVEDQARAVVQAKITRGAPYSAETVSESVQTLADGNRIVDRRVSRVYRDAEGRTRTEQVDSNGEVVNVSISDPVQGVAFMLEPRSRRAFQSNVIVATSAGFKINPGGPAGMAADEAAIAVKRQAEEKAAAAADEIKLAKKRALEEAAAAGTVAPKTTQPVANWVAVAPAGMPMKVPDTADVTSEDLGKQMVNGVMATGSRVTTVIPTGAIGNEQPIRIVSEQWFSPDLQMLVLTRHLDPRVGDTTYQVTNIVRADQARGLFEVPPDYTMQQSVIRRDITR